MRLARRRIRFAAVHNTLDDTLLNRACIIKTSDVSPDPQLQRFALCVAGPRDFVINLLINGTIAWWLFSGAAEIPVAGAGSIFEMLLPMAAIESTATSFTGLLNGTSKLRKRALVQAAFPRRTWLVRALRYSLLQGVFGFLASLIAMFVVRLTIPTVTLSPATVTIVIGLIAGTLGYVVHSRGMLKSASLFAN
ncbi:MAG TPA: hypothetical protein VHY91_20545 [Pirellulales bacterium]|jgi:hypothetical protein|nr:hypothetical protein [Pirellulales bacterium]